MTDCGNEPEKVCAWISFVDANGILDAGVLFEVDIDAFLSHA